MLAGQRVVVVMPAYNAAETLERTVAELPDLVDHVIVTDDASSDSTAELSRRLGLETIVHADNRGYGGNQKTCYAAALAAGADLVVMVHPDYQYSPRLVGAMAAMITSGHYDVVLASRILGGKARSGGMPIYKYFANRLLTLAQNVACGAKLSEYHTGFRAFRREVVESLPLSANSDDFVFDNQMLVQALFAGYRFGEITCPTRYFDEASSISFGRSVRYGLGVLGCSLAYVAAASGLYRTGFLKGIERRELRP